MKKIALILIVLLIAFSCNNVKKDSKNEKTTTEEITAVYRSIEVDIEGMTCEIGCAKMIESKLSKTEGVTFAKVNFEAKKGVFTFDTNKTNKEAIANKITGIAGGDLYKVTQTTVLEAVIDKQID